MMEDFESWAMSAEVGERPVEVIDPESVEHAFFDEPENQGVDMVEHFRQLHTDAGELVDTEESAIVDLIGRRAKMRDAPVLVGDESVELRPASNIADPAD